MSGENNAYDTIKNVIDYIEENIYENLSLDDLAEYSQISKFYLHKIFKYMTGEKLMDYVRHRKLACSVNELIHSNLKIIDIANEYHFDYEQSYIRSFKNAFSISPNQFRIKKPMLEIKEKANLEYITPIGENGMVFAPKIIYKPEFHVIGTPVLMHFCHIEHYDEANRVSCEFRTRLNHIKNIKYENTFLSLIKHHPTMEEYKYYVPCAEVKSVVDVPDGMKSYRIPSNKYAAFRHLCTNPEEKVTKDLNAMNNYLIEWLKKAPYEMTGDYLIERADFSAEENGFREYELFVPIKAKGHF